MTQTFRQSRPRADGTPSFAISDWLLTPAPWRVDQPPTPDQQRWLFVLTGIVLTDFQGQSSDNWREDILELYPDNAITEALYSVRQRRDGIGVGFHVEQWAPFATVNATFDAESVCQCRIWRQRSYPNLRDVGRSTTDTPDIRGS
jgi:hypothetical protein